MLKKDRNEKQIAPDWIKFCLFRFHMPFPVYSRQQQQKQYFTQWLWTASKSYLDRYLDLEYLDILAYMIYLGT